MRTPAAPLLLPLLLAACAGTGLDWAGAVRTEDPEPSGPRGLRDYKESYYRALGREVTGSVSFAELLESLRAARVLFLGDHHRDRKLHALDLHLLERLGRTRRRVVLGLEAIGTQDDGDLREFLAGHISLADLRQRVSRRWPDSWLDSTVVDAPYYRELLRLAKRHAWPVFALEPTPRTVLALRDDTIAASIRRAAAAQPDRLIVAVVGHAHLLGRGDLIARVGLPHVAIGARPSKSLRHQLARDGFPARAELVRTSSGVLLYSSPPATTGTGSRRPRTSRAATR